MTIIEGYASPSAVEPATHWWDVPVWFAGHAVVAILIFLLIAAPALALDLIVKEFATRGVNPYLVAGLALAEYTYFGVDLVVFVLFLMRTGWRAIGMLWRDR